MNNPVPPLTDTLGSAIDDIGGITWADPREFAAEVIVASVQENTVVRKHVEAARYPGVYLDLHEVRCTRESTLKGDLAQSQVAFYYFADGRYPGATPNPRYKRLFEADPGARFVFFLKRERGLLRSIGDVGDYSIRVVSGRHPDTGVRDHLGASLAAILLVPGDGADLKLMAQKLVSYSLIADTLGSRLVDFRLIRDLSNRPEPLRSSACGVLVLNYPGQDLCLQSILNDPKEPEEMREQARRMWTERTKARKQLVRELDDPARLAFPDSDSRKRIREELQILLESDDPSLSDRACRALRRYYPYERAAAVCEATPAR